MSDAIILADVEFTQSEIESFIESGKTLLVKFRSIFEVKRSHCGIIARPVFYHRGDLPLTKRGRHSMMTPSEANALIANNLFI